MADRVRLQAIVENNPETWADIGPDGISLPVDVTGSVLPTGASTSNNQTNGNQKTQIVETVPTDSNHLNPSTALSYDVNGDLKYIDVTIGSTTYRTTLTYTARVLVGVSAAVEL